MPRLGAGGLITGAGRLWNSSVARGQKSDFQVSVRRVAPLLFHSDMGQE